MQAQAGNPYRRVVFRKWRNGDVIALWPDSLHRGGYGFVMSYEHIGQHGGADYHGVVAATKPATPEEYADLLAELSGPVGYEGLHVVKRASVRCVEWPQYV